MTADDSGMSSMMSSRSGLKFEYMMTPIQREWYLTSANCNYEKMCKLLRDNPDLVDWRSYVDGNTALHYAAKFGDCGLIFLLCGNHKADVHVQNHVGFTPLHLAAAGAHSEAIHNLRSVYGARSDVLDYRGHPPSYYLPKTKAGQALKSFDTFGYLRDHLLDLLAQHDSPLRLLMTKQPAPPRKGLDRSGETVVDAAAGQQGGQQLFSSRLPFASCFPWASSETATPAPSGGSGDAPVPVEPDPLPPESPSGTCTPLLPRRLLNSSLVMRIRGRSADSSLSRDRSRSSSRQRRGDGREPGSGPACSLEEEVQALLRFRRRAKPGQQQPVTQGLSPATARRGTPVPDPNFPEGGSMGSTPGSPIGRR